MQHKSKYSQKFYTVVICICKPMLKTVRNTIMVNFGQILLAINIILWKFEMTIGTKSGMSHSSPFLETG